MLSSGGVVNATSFEISPTVAFAVEFELELLPKRLDIARCLKGRLIFRKIEVVTRKKVSCEV